MAEAKKRGTYQRTEGKRAAILEAAWQVMLERGFYDTTTARVAQRSGVARAGLMYHFPTKEHLLLGVMEKRFDENQELFAEHEEQGVCVLDTFVELARRRQSDPETATLLMVLAGASIDPANPAHKWYRDRYEYIREGLTARVRADQQRGEIRSDIDARAIALQLVTITEGLLLQWLNDQHAIDLVEATSQYCDIVRAVPQSTGKA